jgi:hypothetical protein
MPDVFHHAASLPPRWTSRWGCGKAHRELVAHFAAEHPRLRRPKMMGIGGPPSEDQTGLGRDEPKVLLVADARGSLNASTHLSMLPAFLSRVGPDRGLSASSPASRGGTSGADAVGFSALGRHPFPRRVGEHRGQPASSIAVVCTVAISCFPSALGTISSPLESEA